MPPLQYLPFPPKKSRFFSCLPIKLPQLNSNMHSIERFLQDITELKERHRTATESLASLWASYEEVIALKPKRGRSFDKTPLTDRDWVMLRNWFPGYFPVNSGSTLYTSSYLCLRLIKTQIQEITALTVCY